MTYRFGPFEIDPAARELRARGERVETEPKAFDLLVHLIENRDRAVSKDELLNAVWPRQIVTETALTRAIMKARRAVGDDSSRQAVIRTVHGHGYRFIAAVDTDAAAAGTTDDERPAAAAEPGAPRRRDGRRLALAAVAVLVVSAAAVLLPLRDAMRPPDGGSIAVLPVANRVADAEFAWVRLGLMSLLQRMLEEGGLEVVPDASVLAAVGDDDPAAPPGIERFDAILRQTGAGSLLHTTLDRQGGLHRLAAVLMSADGRKTRRVIVGESPARLAADMASVYAQLLAGSDFRSGGRFALVSADPFVNEMYARALDLELQGRLEEARRLFRLAADQEPELFWLRYEIALCTRDLREWDRAEALFDELYEEAAAGRDPRAMVVTLNSHGVMQFNRNRYDEAEALFLEALEATEAHDQPSDRASVLINLGLVASRRGRLDTAQDFYDRALDAFDEAGADPAPSFLNNYAGLLLRRGDLEQARAFAERAVEGFRVKGHRRFEAPSLNRLARILRRQGDFEAAIQRHEEALAIHRELGNEVGELAVMGALSEVYRERGDLTRAGRLARDALEGSRRVGDELLLGDALMHTARVDGDFSHHAAALDGYEAALGLFDKMGDAEGLRGAEAGVVSMALELGRIDRARQVAEAAMASATEAGQAREVALARLLLGQVAEARDEIAAAAGHYDSALDYARAAADREVLSQSAKRLAELELARGEADAAAALLEEARGLAAADREFLRLEARLSLAQGDKAGAAAILEQLRQQAGEAWTDDDDVLLASARNQ